MSRIRYLSFCLLFAALISFVALPGCNSPSGVKDKERKAHDHPKHGPHGGPYAEWEGGEDELHVEFTIDHAAKQVTLYVLDEHCKHSPTKLDVKKITKMKLTITNPKPIFSVDMTYDAKKSEGNQGFAFVGTHERFAEKVDFKGTIDGKIEGAKDLSGDFPNPNYKKPEKSVNLRHLYLTPGGIYTAADVQANGNTTAADKLGGRTWKHSKDVKPGDKICPITDQKANAECAWIVNGQRYEFCCPPCVDDFMVMAHDDQEKTKIKSAKEYVHKGD